ncbi:ABC-type branched-chain amino acid transport system, periplasmic component [Chamaesiphon minutus PCC 6605]|uniref:ABC-type branched-chain amino acid transport system, periplasmic component n=1 Tax=Chamaesiphon minutus (strain ATCC 27169 / PCC 6605) TaxID=1173020 RepID=K9UJ62_CHAP6|nr:ABC-type branched-chain amino acid transport system, periplasmic component [Chamaesiphon minutus PCC 6605]
MGGAGVAGTLLLKACSNPSSTPTASPGASPASAPAADGKKGIKVGVMYSTTGSIAIVEKSLQDATFLAIDQINEGTGPWAGKKGINGQMIEKVVVNPDSNWDLYNQMSKRLIDEDKVACVLGCYTSASRKSVLPVFEEKDRLLYYPVYYEGNECSSNVFYTGAAPNQQITDSIPYCIKNFGKKGFFIGSDYIYPKESNRIAKAELVNGGGTVVGDEYAALGTTEFITIINKIKQAKPDFILSNLVGDSIPAFYKQLKDAGITSKDIPIMAFPTTEEEIQAMGPEFAEGHFSSFNYFQTVDTPENKAFVEQFKAKFGNERVTNGVMEAAYIQTFFMAQAMEKCAKENKELTTSNLREATRGQEFKAPQGTVKSDPDNYHTYLYSRIGKWKADGQAEIVFSTKAAVKPIPWSQALYKGRICVHKTPDMRSNPIVETKKPIPIAFLDKP